MEDVLEDWFKEKDMYCSKCKDRLTVGEVRTHFLYKPKMSEVLCYQCSRKGYERFNTKEDL